MNSRRMILFDCVPHTTFVLASIHMCSGNTAAAEAESAAAEASSGGGGERRLHHT